MLTTKKLPIHIPLALIFLSAGLFMLVLFLPLTQTSSDRSNLAMNIPAGDQTELTFAAAQYYFNTGEFADGTYIPERSIQIFDALAHTEESYTNKLFWYQKGRVNFVLGRHESSIKDFQQHYKLYGDTIPNIYYVKGLAYGYMAREASSLGYWHKARDNFLLYLEKDRANPWAQVDLAWVYFSYGDYHSMRTVLEPGLEQHPDHPWLLNMYGLNLMSLGDSSAAVLAFEQAGVHAEKLTIDDWAIAYPGNNPAYYSRQLNEFVQIIEYNKLLAISNENQDTLDNSIFSDYGFVFFQNQLSPNGVLGGVAVPACGQSNIPPPSAPTVDLEAEVNTTTYTDDVSVVPADTVTISWSSSDASTCEGRNELSSHVSGTSGDFDVDLTEFDIGESRDYGIRCRRSSGGQNSNWTESSISVTLLGLDLNLSLDREIIRAGETVIMEWDVAIAGEATDPSYADTLPASLQCDLVGAIRADINIQEEPSGSMQSDPIFNFFNNRLRCVYPDSVHEFSVTTPLEVIPAPRER